MKHKTVKGILIACCSVLLAALVSFSVYMGIHNNSKGYETGCGGIIPAPQKTWSAGYYKINGAKFQTLLSKQEIKDYYQDYFKTLAHVSIAQSHAAGPADKAYYDKQQGLIVYADIIFLQDEDALYYVIWYDAYGDGVGINILEPPKTSAPQAFCTPARSK